MAPPAKRRRRNTLETSEDEDGHGPRVNTLDSFLHSSPSSTSSPAKTKKKTEPVAPPSPTRPRTTRSTQPSDSQQQQQQQQHGRTPLRQTRRSQAPRSGAGSSIPRAKGTGQLQENKEKERHKEEVGKTASLRSLFSKQEQLASSRRGRKAATPTATTSTTTATAAATGAFDDRNYDLISSDDDIAEARAGSSSSLVGQHARKRLKNNPGSSDAQPTITSSFSAAGQRFLKPPRPSPAAAAPVREPLDEDLRPWSERFGPRNLDELAVHKRKVGDVRKWLDDVMRGRLRQRLLVLKGAAGSGKTTTVRLLAREMGCEVLEWRNPAGNAGTGFVSASAQFDEFLGRGRKFGALDLEGPPSPPPSSSGAASQGSKIILVEEFPNTFSRASTALAAFRQAILQYVVSHMPPPSLFGQPQQQQQHGEPVTPIVLVISETLLTTTSASADSLTAHRLLGAEILSHPGVGLIEFNVIAPTLLAKALELVVQKESRKSGRRRTPGPLVLKKLGEIGDIRSAISSLEFLCLKGDHDADWGGRVTFTRQKKGVKDAIALTRGEQESLEMVSRREASLGIFHAVGKVVYNKREEKAKAAAAAAAEENLPAFLSHCARPRRSEVSVDALMDETGTDTHTFVSALHENYALSCESTDPMDLSTSVDYINDCIDSLSLCDLLCPSRDIFFGGRGGGGGGGFSGSGADAASQLLRQDEMMFQVAVRGMLYSLPSPVKRQSRPSGSQRGGDAFKMFYPTGLKLWRAREETEGMVDVLTTKLLKGEISQELAAENAQASAGPRVFRRAADSSSSSSSLFPPTSTTSIRTPSNQQPPDDPSAHRETDENQGSRGGGGGARIRGLATLGDTARREMLLDRLPYMAHMARSRKTRQVRDLEKIVSFQGFAVPGDDEDEDSDDGYDDGGSAGGGGGGGGGAAGGGPRGGQGEGGWATDRPTEETSPRRRAGIRAGGVTSMSVMAQKLVLSDDDIED